MDLPPAELLIALRAYTAALKFARGMSIKPQDAAQVETVQITATESEIIAAGISQAADTIECLQAEAEGRREALEDARWRLSCIAQMHTIDGKNGPPTDSEILGRCFEEAQKGVVAARDTLSKYPRALRKANLTKEG